MTQTPSKLASNTLLRNAYIVFGVTIGCFLVGGGWQLIWDRDELYYGCFHSCYSPREIIGGYVFLYILGGGLAATLGTAISVTALVLMHLHQRHKN